MEKFASVGIDLGTSNSALAVASADSESVEVIPVSQVFGPGQVGEKELLPSALYFPPENEGGAGLLELPWSESGKGDVVVGEYARARGSLSTDRLVVSAKSWLCNPHVDRRSGILPWRSSSVTEKISPVQAAELCLKHLLGAFNYQRRARAWQPDAENFPVVLTVPASFDEVARGLTFEAAQQAGLGDVLLLEEPQAAFYAWISVAGEDWRKQVRPGDVVLVCDVGGGTADFSLIAVSAEEGSLRLDRISVGEHILLGGDNMDLALAFTLREELKKQGRELDQWQFLSLVQGAREGKERLFADPALTEYALSVPGRSSSIFANTVATKMFREQLDRVVVDGFFPQTGAMDFPAQRKSAGLREYGLPYAAEPALSKHLALFLAQSWKNVSSDARLSALLAEHQVVTTQNLVLPTAVLFNGGVFKAEQLRQRVLELLRSWGEEQPLRELQGSNLDLAVARGAAFYGRARARKQDFRIRAGASRSYYLGIESSMLAVPGYRPPIKGLCIVPQGMEEGTELELTGNEFGLAVGKPVTFRFFSSAARAGDRIGTVVEDAEAELQESAQLEIVLPNLEGQLGDIVPVRLHSVFTEVGTLELWMQHHQSAQRWKLEFNVRGSE